MNSLPPPSDTALYIYLALARFPGMQGLIRARMRTELFRRGAIASRDFEAEVQARARRSQAREGLLKLGQEESEAAWQTRQARIRDYLTDHYFASHIPYIEFEDLVREVLAEHRPAHTGRLPDFNPELAPMEVLFSTARRFENLPLDERKQIEPHLNEIKVILIRRMISDNLSYVSLARQWFATSDLIWIRDRRIGPGRVGGKAAGLLLAARVLERAPDGAPHTDLQLPESVFLGADVMIQFMRANGLMAWADLKYHPLDEIQESYPRLQQAFLDGELPAAVLDRLEEALAAFDGVPLVVRSSSFLEDNFGSSFAGMYETVFCPNQGTREANLDDLGRAIKQVFASAFRPDALVYRNRQGLLDYDERMAVLIQEVAGERHGGFFFPRAAGVAFSQNLFRWTPRIVKEEGMVRMVWGLGTRAVGRLGQDYPRLVALSHPLLRPESSPREIRRYSQTQIDLIDLEANRFASRPISEVLRRGYPGVALMAAYDEGEYLRPLLHGGDVDPERMVITFDGLLRKTNFVPLMRSTLKHLEAIYRSPVSVEFAAALQPDSYPPKVRVTLLQCRPMTRGYETRDLAIPSDVPEEDRLFSASRMVPHGLAEDIHYIVYVDREAYGTIPQSVVKVEIGRLIGRLNQRLDEQAYILVGPGRWGSKDLDVGVGVTYADIYNARVLVELALPHGDVAPSYGTHFFQDLVESQIYLLAVDPRAHGDLFNRDFFERSPNALADLLPAEEDLSAYVKVVDVPATASGRLLQVVMDGEANEALAYLGRGPAQG